MTNAALKSIASELAGVKATEVVPAASGGNSRVYMVATEGKLYALKQYPEIENDKRNRLETERHALELMHWHGIRSIPEWIAAKDNYALMGWIDGFVIKEPKACDVDDAAIFLGTLHHISRKTHEEDMPLASEACISGKAIVDQLEARVTALMPYTKENPALMQFLSKHFLPVFAHRMAAAKTAHAQFSEPLPFEERTLIAADFGFHNIMRSLDGALYFIDFEYFGWDDPVKLMSDFLLHPATALSGEMKKNFYHHTLAIYGEAVAARFAAYFPLFGLRWTLILLNEFIPQRWAARAAARGHTADNQAEWESVKTEQLAKAEAMLTMSEKFA
ncbi:MAG: aminoglycoside phosphotransferase family protein [Alphaproteobacteria bacterium]|nr:aminoglycoside phosphotransferase family protein [Alphaproteobacteria bacterium]